MPKGSPEDLLNALSTRIDELSGSAIESTVTIEADGRTGWTAEEVLDFFDKKLHWDITNRDVQAYADAVVSYLNMGYDAWRQAGYDEQPYTLERWYKDTKMNYPDEIEEFEALYGSTEIEDDSIMCPEGVCDINDKKDTVYAADFDTDPYIVALVGALDTVLMPDTITNWVVYEDTLYVDVDEATDKGTTPVTYEIPLSDLSFDMERIDEDLEYVKNEFAYLVSDISDLPDSDGFYEDDVLEEL